MKEIQFQKMEITPETKEKPILVTLKKNPTLEAIFSQKSKYILEFKLIEFQVIKAQNYLNQKKQNPIIFYKLN